MNKQYVNVGRRPTTLRAVINQMGPFTFLLRMPSLPFSQGGPKMTRYQRHNDESVYATMAVGSSGKGLKIKRFLSLFQVRQRFLFVQRSKSRTKRPHRDF